MTDTTDIMTPSREEKSSHNIDIPPLWNRISLAAILLLSIFMEFFKLGQNGYGNLFYAAGIRSMIDSWHNFFFNAYDPGGFVTIDKPPVGFWLQALSAKIFGFTPFSIFLPQALCGVLAVLLLYYLVRRHFGAVAGLLAALALAVSPISVVTDRNNTIDGTLALVLLLAAWAVIRASESGKLRWLVLSGVFVGLGFNIKMAEAYLVVPALGLTYLLCAPRKLWTRIWHLLLVAIIMLVISLSWAEIVDLVPASQRPYVGSTQNNSEVSLAFGYNGINRLHLGGNGFGGGGSRHTTTTTTSSSPRANTTTGANGGRTFTPPTRTFSPGGGFGGGGGLNPLNLFSVSMGGQIGWLLPFGLLGILALACLRRPRFQQDRQQLGLALWGCWLLTMAIFFTVNGALHLYYMTEMAPGLSAMVGIGMVVMWQEYRKQSWHGWLLPLALILTAITQISMLSHYPAYARWLSPLIGIVTALVVIALIVFRAGTKLWLNPTLNRGIRGAASVGLLILLVAPTIWAGYAVLNNVENSDPLAGPTATAGSATARNGLAFRGIGITNFGFGGTAQANPALISYLQAHQGNTKFLVATPSSTLADPIILATNKPVMSMGGFSGSDPILTTSSLQTLIKDNTVRYFLINSAQNPQNIFDRLPEQIIERLPDQLRETIAGRSGFGGFGNAGNTTLTSWITKNCTAVPTSAWQPSASPTTTSQLYDCAHSGS
jgi:4-amino-4-deoxy-L-arabinose transferase-like glycosyltransferase